MTDVNFQSNNFIHKFLVVTKTTKSGQADESRHHVSSSLENTKLAQAADELPK